MYAFVFVHHRVFVVHQILTVILYIGTCQKATQTNRYWKVVERVSHTWGLIKIGIKPIQMKPHYLIIFEEYEKEYTIFEFDGFH